MLQPYIVSAITLSDHYIDNEEIEKLPVLSVIRNGLPAPSWTQKCEYKLEIWYSVLVSVCIAHLSQEK